MIGQHSVELRQSRVCHDCLATGPGVMFTVGLEPYRCDDCLNVSRHRQRPYRRGPSGNDRPMLVANLTIGDWLDILAAYGYRCAYCNRHASERLLVRDHVLSPEAGGLHTKANVVPICRRCNSQKRHKLPIGRWRPNPPGHNWPALPVAIYPPGWLPPNSLLRR